VQQKLVRALQGLRYDVRLQGAFGNVVAVPRRVESPLTIIAAHYDSVPCTPGADDNASGIAVMMALAHALSGASSSVGFLALNGEEDGLLGSRDFVANGIDALGCALGVVHVLEMVGYRPTAGTQTLPVPLLTRRFRQPNFVGVIGHGPSNAVVRDIARSTTAAALRVVTARTWGPISRVVPEIARSDHFSFWEQKLPAVLWTDTADLRNPHYHARTDTPDTLDYAFMREVAALLLAVVEKPMR
jgi:Zn-dependent M28 family amino/carboxypeptidase